MTNREKLFNLIGQVQDCGCDVTDVVAMNYVENDILVDYLIKNGVYISEPCEVESDNHRVPTNGDKIRSMSDAELAKWISGGAMHSDSACSYCEYNKNKTCNGSQCQDVTDAEIITKWLQQPVKEE